jgi:hypothetical protein
MGSQARNLHRFTAPISTTLLSPGSTSERDMANTAPRRVNIGGRLTDRRPELPESASLTASSWARMVIGFPDRI